MLRGAPDSFYGGLGTVSGLTLWGTLQRTRDDLERSFVLLLAQASAQALPCAEVVTYNGLVARQFSLERGGLDEANAASAYTGLSVPAGMPTLTACQAGAESIWLRPEQAQATLTNAVARYRGLQGRAAQAQSRGNIMMRGASDTTALAIGGNVLVGWAAQELADRSYQSVTSDSLHAHEAEVAAFLATRKGAVSTPAAQAALASLDLTRGRLPWGLSPLAGLLIAFGTGLVAGGVLCYIFGRSQKPALQGAMPRRKRALVMA